MARKTTFMDEQFGSADYDPNDPGDFESGLVLMLSQSPNEWRLKVYHLMNEIPAGHVITYGGLAKRAQVKHGLRINARNVAWLRDRLYAILTFDTSIPLHRIAKKGDPRSKSDSPEAHEYNRRLRIAEGSWPNPIWLYE